MGIRLDELINYNYFKIFILVNDFIHQIKILSVERWCKEYFLDSQWNISVKYVIPFHMSYGKQKCNKFMQDATHRC